MVNLVEIAHGEVKNLSELHSQYKEWGLQNVHL